MKAFRYITALLLLTISIAACTGDRSNATLGGTKDTSAKLGGSGTSAPIDSNKMDSVNKGNVDPTGRGGSDSSSKPVH